MKLLDNFFENISLTDDLSFYNYTYIIGFITISIFDITAITDDFLIFFILSFIICPFIGALILYFIIMLNLLFDISQIIANFLRKLRYSV
jgi:hypothetical protein